MPEPVYGLSADDVEVIQRLLRRERERVQNTQNRPAPSFDLPPSPDVFIVRAPYPDPTVAGDAGGIPALGYEFVPNLGYVGTGSGTHALAHPGFAVCDVHRILPDDDDVPSLFPEYVDQLVYNIGDSDVPAGAWVIAWRERFGDWVCDSAAVDLSPEFGTGTGTGTGTGHFGWAEFKTDCEDGLNVRYRRTVVVAADPTKSFATPWTFDSFQGSCDFPGTGTGTTLICSPILTYEQEVRCESGELNVYRRSNILEIVEGCLVKTTSAWSFYRNVWPCPPTNPDTGTGTSTSTGTGGSDYVYNVSCPCVPIKRVLRLTFTGGTGSCTCLNGATCLLTYDGTQWKGTMTQGCNGNTYTWRFGCTVGSFGLSEQSGFCVSFIPSTFNCTPLEAIFNGTGTADCCLGTIHASVTEP